MFFVSTPTETTGVLNTWASVSHEHMKQHARKENLCSDHAYCPCHMRQVLQDVATPKMYQIKTCTPCAGSLPIAHERLFSHSCGVIHILGPGKLCHALVT